MILNVSPEVEVNKLWPNFNYLIEVFEEFHPSTSSKVHWSTPYHEPIRAIEKYDYSNNGSQKRPPNICPFHIIQSRQLFRQLLMFIMSEKELNSLSSVIILSITQKNLQQKYDLEIQFADTFNQWPIVFYFNSIFLLQGYSAHYQYIKNPVRHRDTVVYRHPVDERIQQLI